jgi:hypothetical protein
MDFNLQLKPYLNGNIKINVRAFILESVEEDHLVLRDENAMHTVVWFSSIQFIKEDPLNSPEIVLFPISKSCDQD